MAPITATPTAFARWGGTVGLLLARRIIDGGIGRKDRRALIAAQRKRVKLAAVEFREIGASEDEVNLYTATFEQALAAQLAAPEQQITVGVIG